MGIPVEALGDVLKDVAGLKHSTILAFLVTLPLLLSLNEKAACAGSQLLSVVGDDEVLLLLVLQTALF